MGASCVYMLVLRFLARPIIYTMLFLLILSMLSACAVCYARSGMTIFGFSGDTLVTLLNSTITATDSGDPVAKAVLSVAEGQQWVYTAAFWVLTILTLLTLLFLIVARKKIKRCADVVSASTAVFGSMPSLMLFPNISTVLQARATRSIAPTLRHTLTTHTPNTPLTH